MFDKIINKLEVVFKESVQRMDRLIQVLETTNKLLEEQNKLLRNHH